MTRSRTVGSGTCDLAANVREVAFACLCLLGPVIGHAEELESTAIYERLEPSLCGVRALADTGEELQSGSGFAWTQTQVVTNYHVVARARKVVLDCNGAKSVATRVVGFQENVDLVLLDSGLSNLVPVARELSATRPGSVVYALGNPFGLSNTITSGLVSGTRNFPGGEFLQISADIHPGNSGGPVVDASGDVIGVATMRIDDASGLNFAIPTRYVEALPAVSIELGQFSAPELAAASPSTVAATLSFRGIPLGSACERVRSLPDRRAQAGERNNELPPGTLVTELIGVAVGVSYGCLERQLVSGRYSFIPFSIVTQVYEGVRSRYGEPTSGRFAGPSTPAGHAVWDLGAGRQIDLESRSASSWELTYTDFGLIRELGRRAVQDSDL